MAKFSLKELVVILLRHQIVVILQYEFWVFWECHLLIWYHLLPQTKCDIIGFDEYDENDLAIYVADYIA